VFRIGDHDPVLGLGGHLGGAARQTPPGGPALVSGRELFEDRLQYALTRCYELITTLYLNSAPDPEPAMASKKQDAQRRQSRFVVEYQEAA